MRVTAEHQQGFMQGLKCALAIAEANTTGKHSRPVCAIKKQIRTLELIIEVRNDSKQQKNT